MRFHLRDDWTRTILLPTSLAASAFSLHSLDSSDIDFTLACTQPSCVLLCCTFASGSCRIVDISQRDGSALDIRLQIFGLACSAKFQNAVTQGLHQFSTAWDFDSFSHLIQACGHGCMWSSGCGFISIGAGLIEFPTSVSDAHSQSHCIHSASPVISTFFWSK